MAFMRSLHVYPEAQQGDKETRKQSSFGCCSSECSNSSSPCCCNSTPRLLLQHQQLLLLQETDSRSRCCCNISSSCCCRRQTVAVVVAATSAALAAAGDRQSQSTYGGSQTPQRAPCTPCPKQTLHCSCSGATATAARAANAIASVAGAGGRKDIPAEGTTETQLHAKETPLYRWGCAAALQSLKKRQQPPRRHSVTQQSPSVSCSSMQQSPSYVPYMAVSKGTRISSASRSTV